MCAFKGAGHDRLVSRRWLTHGPWALLRRERDDVSVVLFHNTEADPQTAFDQAMPAHERMGISPRGGYLYREQDYKHDLDGRYFDADRSFRMVVDGRQVSEEEMLDLCAFRRDSDKPIDVAGFVFPDEAEARAHLHELWLRELACWTFIAGQQVRIDLDYSPALDRPDWVAEVEARYADALDTPIVLKEIGDFGDDGELAIPDGRDPFVRAIHREGAYWDDMVAELGQESANNLMDWLASAGFDEEPEWLSQIRVAQRTLLAELYGLARIGRVDEAEHRFQAFGGELPDRDWRHMDRALHGAWSVGAAP